MDDRIGEVRLQHDDATGSFQVPDPVGRAAGDARRVGERWRRGDGQRRLQTIHRGEQARIGRRGSGTRRPHDLAVPDQTTVRHEGIHEAHRGASRHRRAGA